MINQLLVYSPNLRRFFCLYLWCDQLFLYFSSVNWKVSLFVYNLRGYLQTSLIWFWYFLTTYSLVDILEEVKFTNHWHFPYYLGGRTFLKSTQIFSYRDWFGNKCKLSTKINIKDGQKMEVLYAIFKEILSNAQGNADNWNAVH